MFLILMYRYDGSGFASGDFDYNSETEFDQASSGPCLPVSHWIAMALDVRCFEWIEHEREIHFQNV